MQMQKTSSRGPDSHRDHGCFFFEEVNFIKFLGEHFEAVAQAALWRAQARARQCAEQGSKCVTKN